ncbi:MAG: hypothetical protein PX637_16265 [Microcystis sp. M53601_WE4]|nr:hypothetical protein [Microcystis sp. M53601_WE4]
MGKTPHPTPHTLPPRKTFCRKPYVGWIHAEGLKNSVTEIIRQLCYVNDEAKNS